LRERSSLPPRKSSFGPNDQSALSDPGHCRPVGVTPPSIYLHFADRTDLVFEVCGRHAEQLEQAMAEAAEGIEKSMGEIRRRGYAYLRWDLTILSTTAS